MTAVTSPANPAGCGSSTPMSILFVEDDAMNRRVIRDMLKVVGAEMSEAADAETGLAMIDHGDFRVVLMDLRMPGMDGLSALAKLRARGDAKARLPVIVVTADTAIDLRARCLAGGADDVILKPVAMGALLNAVGRIVAQSSGDEIMID